MRVSSKHWQVTRRNSWNTRKSRLKCAQVCYFSFSSFFLIDLVRDSTKTFKRDYDKTEDDLKALQSVGQIIGEVLKQLDEERCELSSFCHHF